MEKVIPFSPPDISNKEIDEVVDTLKSGWITTGPKTKLFEKKISEYCNSEKTVCLNSATAGLELALRLFNIGKGDEVITTPLTYTATANVILHTGAKPVFADVFKNSFHIDSDEIRKKITKKTKAVISVDYGGFPCDYNEIRNVISENKKFKSGNNIYQKVLNKILLIDDAAHSFGSMYGGKRIGDGTISDFTVFSFHAVKNLTTAEGGAISFNSFPDISSEEVYKQLMLLSLHGQNKDALSKTKAGNWKYNIELAGYKFNMTDIQAAIGLAQLSRYDNEIIPKRSKLFSIYMDQFKNDERFTVPNFSENNRENNFHLFPLRINGIDENKRDAIIQKMADKKISLNVHFIPLPLHSLYRNLGYRMQDYPNSYQVYQNLITLPLYSKLNEEDAFYLCEELKKVI